MLDDRDYIRAPDYRSGLSLTIWLIIVNAAAFVLQNLAYLAFPRFPTNSVFALSLEGLKAGYVWQLLTFQFMHDTPWPWHLLLNCFAIFMFGRPVEAELGARRFLTLYFAGGVIGGLLQILCAYLFPVRFGGGVVGASAGAFGLVAAFAMLYPERLLTMLVYFVLPITIRAKYLLIAELVFTLLGMLFPGGNVAHAAHLGGMLTGIVFIRWAGQWQWPGFRPSIRRKARPALVVSHSQTAPPWPPPPVADEEELPAAEFISKEVDPILDKISAHGIHSLTERERRILEAARKKMARP